MSLHVALSGWLLDAQPSGANRRLLGLLRAIAPLLAADERITVLHRPAVAPMFVHPQVSWRPVPIPARPSWRRAFAERRLLPRLLRELQVQVLDHGCLPAPRVPCRLCLTLHDLRDADGEGRRQPWLARAVLRRSLARADAVVVPSQFTASRVRVHVPTPPPLHVVPNAVDLPRGRPSSPRARPYLLHTGHLEPRKNLGVLLQALALLMAEGVDAPDLLLAGADAGAGARLHTLAQRLGVAARVLFLGAVPDADLPGLYAGARAVVVPSRYEGFGLCALEGLAAGVPVLVSDRGALPEVVSTAGTVLPADDPAAWAAGIRSTLAAAPSADAAHGLRATTFSWRAAAAAMLGLWRTLANM